MSNLTLDDYRRVLLWCGWKNMTLRDLASTLWRWRACEINERLIDVTLEPLLLLDYSVLEKVRADETRAAKLADHLAALVMPTSYAEDALLSYVLRGEPGCVTRAAIAAGIVSQGEDG